MVVKFLKIILHQNLLLKNKAFIFAKEFNNKLIFMKNFKKITRHTYRVNNEKGLTEALCDYFCINHGHPEDWWHATLEDVENYLYDQKPASYPAFVTIADTVHQGGWCSLEFFNESDLNY